MADALAGAGRLTRAASSFDRRDVVRGFCEALGQGAPVQELEALADGLLADRERTLRLDPWHPPEPDPGARPGGPRYSTPELVALEQRLVASALARRGEGAGLADAAAVEAAAAGRELLSAEQRRMLARLTRSGDGVEVVLGWAGTGKTFGLDACRGAWERSGQAVVGCALSARAAAELRDGAGIRASTIAALLSDLRRGLGLARGSVLVVDEAGMVGSRQLAELAAHARRSAAKLVLVGDDRQLPEIEAGGAFRSLAERLGCVELRSVQRQQQLWDREALAALREGDAGRLLAAYEEHGRLTLGRSAEEAHAALVPTGGRPTRGSRRRGGDARTAPRRRAPAQRPGAGADARVGGARGGGARSRRPSILRRRPRRHDEPKRLSTRAHERHPRDGGLGRPGAMRARPVCDDGRELCVPREYLERGNLDHGYAQTVHKTQGATVDRTFVLGTEEAYREWGYTALTRHRVEARFYATAPEPGDLRAPERDEPDPRERIERRLGHGRAKRLAIDVRDEALRVLPRAQLEAEGEELRAACARYPSHAALKERTISEELERTRRSRAGLEHQVERLQGAGTARLA